MNENKEKKHAHAGHHMGLMMVGCIIMMAVLWFVVGRGGTGAYWPLILICPLMHLVMMAGMSKNQDEQQSPEEQDLIE